MQINTQIIHEAPFRVSDAPLHIAGATSANQVYRWINCGRLRRKDQRYGKKRRLKRRTRVLLEVVKLPDGLYTSLAAYERFIVELNR